MKRDVCGDGMGRLKKMKKKLKADVGTSRKIRAETGEREGGRERKED